MSLMHVVIESQLLLDHLCVGSTLRLADSETQPPTQRAGCCAVLSVDSPKQRWCCQHLPVDVLLVKLLGLCSAII